MKSLKEMFLLLCAEQRLLRSKAGHHIMAQVRLLTCVFGMPAFAHWRAIHRSCLQLRQPGNIAGVSHEFLLEMINSSEGAPGSCRHVVLHCELFQPGELFRPHAMNLVNACRFSLLH